MAIANVSISREWIELYYQWVSGIRFKMLRKTQLNVVEMACNHT